MVLGIIGAGMSIAGAGMNFASGKKREKAVARAQAALTAATNKFHTERGERADALGRVFAGLANQSGMSKLDFLDQRNSEARTRAGELSREGTAANIADARRTIQDRLAPPTGARIQQAAAGGDFRDALGVQMAEIQPDIDVSENQALVGAQQRGFGGFEQGIQDQLGLQLAGFTDQGIQADIGTQLTDAVATNKFASLRRQLGLDLKNAGNKGDKLALIGGLLQQGGNLTMGFGGGPAAAVASGAAAGAALPGLGGGGFVGGAPTSQMPAGGVPGFNTLPGISFPTGSSGALPRTFDNGSTPA